MTIEDLTDQTFSSGISHCYVIVDFWAPWCGPCNRFAPIFERAGQQYADVYFGRVNIDQYQHIAMAERVSSIPTVVFYKNGQEKERFRGAVSNATLDAFIARNKQ